MSLLRIAEPETCIDQDRFQFLCVRNDKYMLTSFPGHAHLQYLIACSMKVWMGKDWDICSCMVTSGRQRAHLCLCRQAEVTVCRFKQVQQIYKQTKTESMLKKQKKPLNECTEAAIPDLWNVWGESARRTHRCFPKFLL